MPFCIYCGSKLKEDANFCMMCGKKVASKNISVENRGNRKEPEEKDKKELGVTLCFLERKLPFSENIVEYNRCWKLFVNKSIDAVKEYEEFYYKNIKSYGEIFGTAIPYIGELLYMFYGYAVRVLKRYGISDVSEPDYESLCSKRVEAVIEEKLQPLIEFAEEISNQAKSMQYEKAVKRENRSQWEGGGFGFSGAIKGAMMAGILNMGTNAVRKLSDAYTDAQDNQIIAKKKREYFKNSNCIQQLKDTVYECGILVFKQTYEILVTQKCMPPVMFQDEKEKRDVLFYLKRMGKTKEESAEQKLFEAVIQNIIKNPYDWELYDILYHLLPYEKQEINKLVDYFGMGYYYYEEARYIDAERLEYIKSLPDITFEDIEKKEMLLKKLAKDAKDINLGTMFAEVRERKEVLLKMEDFQYLLSGDRAVIHFLHPRIKNATTKISNLLDKKDFHMIWDEAEKGNIYAQFVLMQEYELKYVRQKGPFAKDVTPTPEKYFIKTDTAFAKFLKSYLRMLDTKEGFDIFEIERNITTIYKALENKNLQISAVAVCCILWCEARKGFKSNEEFLAAAETLAFCNQPMIVASLGEYYRKKRDYDKAAYFFYIALLYDCDYARKCSSAMSTEKLRKGFDEWCERIGG